MKSIRTKELANLLGVNQDTVRRYVLADKIPFHRTPAGQLYFTAEDVKTIIGDHQETGKNPKSYNELSTADVVVIGRSPCEFREGESVVFTTVDFPSGRVLVTDYIGEPLDVEVGEINGAMGRIQWTTDYATMGVASANVGNSGPRVWLHEPTGNLMVGHWGSLEEDLENLPAYEEPPYEERKDLEYLLEDGTHATEEQVAQENYHWVLNNYEEVLYHRGWKYLPHVTTDLWAFMLTDMETYEKAGGTAAALEANWHGKAVIDLKPGRYHFVTYSNHPDFDSLVREGAPEIFAEAIFEPFPAEEAHDNF